MLISKWRGRSAPFGGEQMPGEPIETELALIRRDIQVINDVLYGNGNDRKGLIDQIATLAGAADRGRWALKTMLWLGGSIVAVLTALGQLRSAWTTIWGHN
jgi:hypothetical protein